MPQSKTPVSQQPLRRDVFAGLTPDRVLEALDSVGLRGDGRLLQLNSYENRVFQLFLEDGSAVVAKFYRPGRWTDEQILEEHSFALELAEAEIPLAPPMLLTNGTLARLNVDGMEYRFSVSPRRAGRPPELEQRDTLYRLGQFIGRLHTVARRRPFQQRMHLNAATYGRRAQRNLASTIPAEQRALWLDRCDAAMEQVERVFASAPEVAQIRLHGDCHLGNVLWREPEGPHFVDFDDACTGPAIQDLWMLIPGEGDDVGFQMDALLSGYRVFSDLDGAELRLIEPLRTLRMIHHSAWLSERWDDPAFPAAFSWFGTPAYWEEQAVQLREQANKMNDLDG